MGDVFISYARQDAPVAQRLSELLREDGVMSYRDKDALVAGDVFSKQIETALADAKVVVVLLSRNSNRSSYVEAELRTALRTGHTVIPVLLDDDATNNWVWPLISDRHALKIDSGMGIEQVAQEVKRAVVGTDSLKAPKATRSSWPIWLAALLSAIAGALVVWFLGN